MLAFLHAARAALAAVHPLLPFICIAAIVGGLVYLWRRFSPTTFDKLPPQIQALPALLISAILAGASSGGDVGRMMIDAAIGAFSGLLSVGGHEALKRLPGPYLGGKWPAAGLDMKGMEKVLSSRKPPPLPPVTMLLLLALGLLSCSGAPPKPGCAPEDNVLAIAAIDKTYLEQLVDQCLMRGYPDRASCPNAAELERQRDAKVEAYKRGCAQ